AVARPDDADTPGPPEPQPVDFLDGVDVPDIGRASERGGGARRDLRQLLGRLRVTDAASDEPDDPSMRPD
ncbi:MAG: hypothetical protein KDA25_02690, partial [Phycisphaerales bacterium]|nr:hypothetical protein [Phycisphaerales bacterium]